MAIKKTDIKKLVSSFKKDGYLNVFVIGREGIGKTTFASQLLEKICEEIDIKMNINMMQFNLEKFLKCKYKVRYLSEILHHSENPVNPVNLFIKKKLDKHINIIEINEEPEEFDSFYYCIKVIERGK